MSPRSNPPAQTSPQNGTPDRDPATPNLGSRPMAIRWGGIFGSALVVLGLAGAVLGFLLFFDQDPTAALTLGSGMSLLICGVVINILVAIWEKIPELE